MSIPNGSVKGNPDLYTARILAGMGVPIFRCKLDADGNPAKAFGWQNTKPGEASYSAIDRWEPGWGLGAVTGHVLDVVDVDPRNGGLESWPLLLSRLRDDPPVIFGVAATPSRGYHFLIPAQGVTRCKLLPGIDLQARSGFIFIAPTIRPSKHPGDSGEPRGYRWISPVHPEATPWYHEPSAAFLELPWDAERIPGAGTARSGRRSPQELQAAVLAAEAGEQRTALLRLVEEYEFAGWPPEAIKDTLRNFLPSVPAFDPDDPWYPARGGNPDRWIHTLIDKYRDGVYLRHGRPIIPDATEDELAGIREVEPVVISKEDPEETAFWHSRPVLRQIYLWSRARMASPWAVLGEALAEAICHTPPSFRLPALVGGEGTLNLLIASVGSSGAGKNVAANAAEAAFKWEGVMGIIDNHVERFPVGSGEGLVQAFGYNANVKDEKGRNTGQTEFRQINTSIIVTIPEIDTLKAMTDRSGATISPELRKLYSGETLGHTYANVAKRVLIRKHTYRACVIAGIQPGRAEFVVGDISGGLAQRWLWLPATDSSAPDLEYGDPPVISWTPPGLISDLAYSDGPHIMKVCPEVAKETRAMRLRSLRGSTDDIEAHALYTREKVAAGLALLDNSDEIRDSDWLLSAFVMRISRRTRIEVQQYLSKQAHNANIAAGKAEGIRRDVAESTAQTQVNNRLASRVLEILKGKKWTSTGKIRNGISAGQRELLQPVLNALVKAGKIESQEVVYQGQEGTRYRRNSG